MTQTERLHAFIASHGFRSWTRGESIEISVPATRRAVDGTVETVTLVERCEPTMTSVRQALGY